MHVCRWRGLSVYVELLAFIGSKRYGEYLLLGELPSLFLAIFGFFWVLGSGVAGSHDLALARRWFSPYCRVIPLF